MSMKLPLEIPINTEPDIVVARRKCREVAKDLKFNLVDQTRLTTATSELARNIFEYAGSGFVRLDEVNDGTGRDGLQIEFVDEGPGIDDIETAMGEGWSSHRGMGMGLPGAKKLMDSFMIESEPGKGTRVVIRKWKR